MATPRFREAADVPEVQKPLLEPTQERKMTTALQTRKPAFKVLEAEAFSSQCPITSRTASPELFAFSFPITDDDLLCEFDLYVSKVLSISVNNCAFDSLPSSASEGTKVTSVRTAPPVKSRKGVNRVSGVMQYIYQKVVSRKFVGFRPSPKSAPEKILFWVKETLECGDSLAVYPVPGENFTARKRSCHECLMRLIKAVEKKPAQAYHETKKKMTGSGVRELAFVSLLVIVVLLWFRYHQPISYTYAEPIHVLRKIDDYRFVMQRAGKPPFTYHFCPDYTPRLEPGMTLLWLSFEDYGKCISIGPADRGYVIERDINGWPTLPRNCHHVGPDVPAVCDGVPQF